MEKVLVLPLLVSFFLTLFIIPVWIKRAKKIGLVGKDIHKKDKEEVAEAGGVPVLIGFILGALVYIATITFYFGSKDFLIEILALLNVLLISSFIGLLDDILGWKIGLNRKTRVIFLIFAAIPLIVVNAGESTMMGIDFGLFYPLFFIPLGIVGATATFNFLAGYNGLESSQGVLILSALALVTWLMGKSWLSIVCLIMVVCLLAFLFFNWCPAKVFPGDVLTYAVGSLIATVAILGDIEKIAVFFFIPYVVEVGLKSRGKLKKQSFGKLNEDGSLDVPHEKFYGLEHVAIFFIKKMKKNNKVYEKEVVCLINLFQILVILIGLFLFRGSIF